MTREMSTFVPGCVHGRRDASGEIGIDRMEDDA